MLTLPPSVKIFVAAQPVDARKSFDGLAALVESEFGLEPLSGHLFLFLNRRGHVAQILFWDRNGFWLLLKRLEQDRFTWPSEETVPTLTIEQLHWLLEGIDIAVVQRHPQRLYERVA